MRRGSYVQMDIGGIPGSVREKCRRVRDGVTRGDLLRPEKKPEKLEDERGKCRACDCPQKRGDSWPGRRSS